MSDIPSLAPVTTLNGKWDAYCHVCWNPVYRFWADKVPPDNRCQFGHDTADACPDAQATARNRARMIKLRAAITQETGE